MSLGPIDLAVTTAVIAVGAVLQAATGMGTGILLAVALTPAKPAVAGDG